MAIDPSPSSFDKVMLQIFLKECQKVRLREQVEISFGCLEQSNW